MLKLVQCLPYGPWEVCNQARGSCINTVQQLFEIEHFGRGAAPASIVSQLIRTRHEIRKAS